MQLVQSHLVDAHAAEKTLSFGSKQELFLGRNPDNDVVLPASAIANKHARIVLKDGRVYLEDLATALGTYLWDKKIPANQPQLMTNGDQFTIFPHRFRVQVERTWTPETDFALSECRITPVNRTEFFQTSPATWRLFVLNAHPSGEQAVLELSPTFLANLQQRILVPLGVEQAKTPAPSDDAMLGFIMLALLENLNRRLRFPMQFSFVRGARKNLSDTTPGMALTFAVRHRWRDRADSTLCATRFPGFGSTGHACRPRCKISCRADLGSPDLGRVRRSDSRRDRAGRPGRHSGRTTRSHCAFSQRLQQGLADGPGRKQQRAIHGR